MGSESGSKHLSLILDDLKCLTNSAIAMISLSKCLFDQGAQKVKNARNQEICGLFYGIRGCVGGFVEGVHDQRVEIYNLWSIKEIVIVSLKNGSLSDFLRSIGELSILTLKKSP